MTKKLPNLPQFTECKISYTAFVKAEYFAKKARKLYDSECIMIGLAKLKDVGSYTTQDIILAKVSEAGKYNATLDSNFLNFFCKKINANGYIIPAILHSHNDFGICFSYDDNEAHRSFVNGSGILTQTQSILRTEIIEEKEVDFDYFIAKQKRKGYFTVREGVGEKIRKDESTIVPVKEVVREQLDFVYSIVVNAVGGKPRAKICIRDYDHELKKLDTLAPYYVQLKVIDGDEKVDDKRLDEEFEGVFKGKKVKPWTI